MIREIWGSVVESDIKIHFPHIKKNALFYPDGVIILRPLAPIVKIRQN